MFPPSGRRFHAKKVIDKVEDKVSSRGTVSKHWLRRVNSIQKSNSIGPNLMLLGAPQLHQTAREAAAVVLGIASRNVHLVKNMRRTGAVNTLRTRCSIGRQRQLDQVEFVMGLDSRL